MRICTYIMELYEIKEAVENSFGRMEKLIHDMGGPY